MASLYLYFELLSLLTAVLVYTRKRNKLLLYFIPFLLLTVMIELVGGGWTPYTFAEYRFALYNIFTSIEFLFYAFLFYIHFRKPLFRKIILLFMPGFILLVLLNFLFVQGFNKTFNTYTFLLGSFFIVIFCCCFFYESVLPDKIDEQLSKQPFFWISSGLLIYYLGSVIINALFEYLTTNDLRTEGMRIYDIINNCLNVILYSSFCIAFFLCPNSKKISS
jgi:peptidoglycan/LPS O-acetylase OafA/YrhL